MHQIIFQYMLHTFCGRLAAEVERVSEGGCQQQQWEAAGRATGAGGRQLLVRRTGEGEGEAGGESGGVCDVTEGSPQQKNEISPKLVYPPSPGFL